MSSHDEQRLQQLMDVCRNGDDLREEEFRELAQAVDADPAMREKFESSQQWDRELEYLLLHVNPPSNSCSKLVRTVLDAQPEAMQRRRWKTVVACAVVAASVLALAAWFSQPRRVMDADAVAAEAAQWIQQLDGQASWESETSPSEYPLDPAVRMAPTSPWKRFPQWDDSRAVVFRDRRDAGVHLFALRTNQVGPLPKEPPTQPQMATGKYRIGVWRRDGLTYVLAVQGEVEDYQRLLIRGMTA